MGLFSCRDISDLTEKLKEWYKTLFEPDSSSSRAKDCLLRALEQMKSQHPNLATHWLSSASAARILHASIQAFYSVEESEDVNVTVCTWCSLAIRLTEVYICRCN